jgi:hypothetical protein
VIHVPVDRDPQFGSADGVQRRRNLVRPEPKRLLADIVRPVGKCWPEA